MTLEDKFARGWGRLRDHSDVKQKESMTPDWKKERAMHSYMQGVYLV